VANLVKRFFEALRRQRKPRSPLLSARTFVPSDHPLRPVLDVRYLDMRGAMASRNPAAIAALLTPDFASIDVHGKQISAQKMIASVVALDIDRSKRTARTVLASIAERDGDAHVEQLYTMTPAPDAPSSMPRSLHTRSHDTWRNVDGTWLLARTDTQEVEVVTSGGKRRYLAKHELYTAELAGPA
jgi:hypothetical protein